MANEYLSQFTGAHNDNYDVRITNLSNTVSTLSNTVLSNYTTLNNNKVAKAGDTMTGHLNMSAKYVYLNSSNITMNTTPSADTTGNSRIQFRDSNNTSFGQIEPGIYTNGNSGLVIDGYRKINNTNYWNTLRLLINASGTPIVSVSNATAWCKALGIPKIAFGRVSITNGKATVTFASEFGETPYIVTSAYGSGTADYQTHSGGASATGFTCYGTSQSDNGAVKQGNFPVNWIAIGTWP